MLTAGNAHFPTPTYNFANLSDWVSALLSLPQAQGKPLSLQELFVTASVTGGGSAPDPNALSQTYYDPQISAFSSWMAIEDNHSLMPSISELQSSPSDKAECLAYAKNAAGVMGFGAEVMADPEFLNLLNLPKCVAYLQHSRQSSSLPAEEKSLTDACKSFYLTSESAYVPAPKPSTQASVPVQPCPPQLEKSYTFQGKSGCVAHQTVQSNDSGELNFKFCRDLQDHALNGHCAEEARKSAFAASCPGAIWQPDLASK